MVFAPFSRMDLQNADAADNEQPGAAWFAHEEATGVRAWCPATYLARLGGRRDAFDPAGQVGALPCSHHHKVDVEAQAETTPGQMIGKT